MKYLPLTFLLIIFPFIAHAQIRITEIAWMGTVESEFGEWIELYNTEADPVSLSSWKLEDGSGKIIFTFSKTIPGQTYFLLERTTPSVPDPVPGVNDEAGSFGGSGLSNNGEILVLKDAQGGVVHTVNASGGWPAGDSKTKETMQWDGNKWLTAAPTPKTATVLVETPDPTPEPVSTTSTKKTPSISSKDEEKPLPVIAPHLTFSFPAAVFKGVAYDFAARAIPEDLNSKQGSLFVWNMGDGTTIKQSTVAPVRYTYFYPGTYTVSVAYYKWHENTTPFLLDTKTVEVRMPQITLSSIEEGTAIEIKNETNTKVDLSKWQIINGNEIGTIAEMTILAPQATIVIPAASLGFRTLSTLSIQTPGGVALTTKASGAPIDSAKSVAPIISPVYSVARAFAPARQYAVVPTVEMSNEAMTSAKVDDTLIASAIGTDPVSQKHQSRTKTLVYGAALIFVIGLFVLLERFMARQE